MLSANIIRYNYGNFRGVVKNSKCVNNAKRLVLILGNKAEGVRRHMNKFANTVKIEVIDYVKESAIPVFFACVLEDIQIGVGVLFGDRANNHHDLECILPLLVVNRSRDFVKMC